jgi:hypothetical protein
MSENLKYITGKSETHNFIDFNNISHTIISAVIKQISATQQAQNSTSPEKHFYTLHFLT